MPLRRIFFLTAIFALAALGPRAQGAQPRAYYLIVEGRVHALPALSAGGEIYLPLVETAFHLGFAADSRPEGLTLSRQGKSVVFSADYTMALTGSQIQPVKPPLWNVDGTLYASQGLIRELLGRFAPPFSLGDSPPKVDLRSEGCLWRIGPEGWTLSFSGEVSPTWNWAGGELSVFVHGARLNLRQEGEKPEGLALQHEKLPLGDRLVWRWPPGKAPAAKPSVERESGSTLRISFAGSVPAARAARALRTVVLDPGHGGAAAGAVGRGGVQEKDVVLGIARLLKPMLEAQGLEVLMTREGDADLPLHERAERANARQGGLFVSIHANASPASSARGAETFFLSYEALDDETRMLAQKENLHAALPGGGEAAEGAPLRAILWHMAQAQYLQDSARLGEEIQRRLNASLSTPDRGVKQAPFAVLMGVAMPAVLVEVGFLSNEREEALLASEDYQRQLASALAESILSFRRQWDARMARGPEAPAAP